MNQENLVDNILREISVLDDSAKLQVAENVLRSLREKITTQETPQEKKASFADLQGIGRGVWSKDGNIDDFIREERESWER